MAIISSLSLQELEVTNQVGAEETSTMEVSTVETKAGMVVGGPRMEGVRYPRCSETSLVAAHEGSPFLPRGSEQLVGARQSGEMHLVTVERWKAAELQGTAVLLLSEPPSRSEAEAGVVDLPNETLE
jgi:hypothetical protein